MSNPDHATIHTDGYRCGCCQQTERRHVMTVRRDGEGRPAQFDLWTCQACGFIQLWPQPDDATLASYYNSHAYYSYHELSTRETARRLSFHDWLRHRIQRLSMETAGCSATPQSWDDRIRSLLCAPLRQRFAGMPRHSPTGPLLDIGCGDGLFLYELRRLGWTVAGLEMDAQAAVAARQYGLDVRDGVVEAPPFPHTSFSVVRMWHVLEHVRNPQLVLAAARRLLMPGGELILGIPNADGLYRQCFGRRWAGWDLPRHLGHFSPRTIRQLLEHEGFRVTLLRCSSVGTGAASLVTVHPWFNHPAIRYPLVLVDLLLDLLGLGDALEVIAEAPS